MFSQVYVDRSKSAGQALVANVLRLGLGVAVVVWTERQGDIEWCHSIVTNQQRSIVMRKESLGRAILYWCK